MATLLVVCLPEKRIGKNSESFTDLEALRIMLKRAKKYTSTRRLFVKVCPTNSVYCYDIYWLLDRLKTISYLLKGRFYLCGVQDYFKYLTG